MTRRKQLLDVLERSEDVNYVKLVMAMIADLDFERGFSLLYHCMQYLQQIDHWENALQAFRKKHGSIAAGVRASLEEDFRRGIIKDFRSQILDPEHRFFLALLMNAPTRADLLALVARRFPKHDPTAVVLRWIDELTQESENGLTILDAQFPDAIEPDSELRRDLFLSSFAHFLNPRKKLPPALRNRPPGDLKALQAAFAASSIGLLMV
jgi:hypothetical protein